jgi:site-specific DNA-cytosine methylase
MILEEAVSIGKGQLNQMSMETVANTLDTMHDAQAIIEPGKPPRKYIVRRLTPTECARLQGFPDWWTDGVQGSDSAKYTMWGNGIALPCAADVLGRIAKFMARGVADDERAGGGDDEHSPGMVVEDIGWAENH